jgi:hypothetical protein
MPPVVAAAAVTGASALAGGALSSRANNKAMKTQDEAARRAEALAIENEKRRREEYDRAEAMAKAQWDAEQQRLAPRRAAQDQLLARTGQRLGLDIGSLGGARPMPYSGGTGTTSGKPRTLADIAGRPVVDVPFTEVQAAPRLSIQDIANWGTPRRMS